MKQKSFDHEQNKFKNLSETYYDNLSSTVIPDPIVETSFRLNNLESLKEMLNKQLKIEAPDKNFVPEKHNISNFEEYEVAIDKFLQLHSENKINFDKIAYEKESILVDDFIDQNSHFCLKQEKFYDKDLFVTLFKSEELIKSLKKSYQKICSFQSLNDNDENS